MYERNCYKINVMAFFNSIVKSFFDPFLVIHENTGAIEVKSAVNILKAL